MAARKNLQREQELPAEMLADEALRKVSEVEIDDEVAAEAREGRELTAAEIARKTQEIEAAKAEKKRRREHRRRLKMAREAAEKKNYWVAPIVLGVSLLISLILWLCYNR